MVGMELCARYLITVKKHPIKGEDVQGSTIKRHPRGMHRVNRNQKTITESSLEELGGIL